MLCYQPSGDANGYLLVTKASSAAETGTATYVLLSANHPALGDGYAGYVDQRALLVLAVGSSLGIRLASTLTPMLCATLLKPIKPGHHDKGGFLGGFHRALNRMTKRDESRVGRLVARSSRFMLVFVVIAGVLAFAKTDAVSGSVRRYIDYLGVE